VLSCIYRYMNGGVKTSGKPRGLGNTERNAGKGSGTKSVREKHLYGPGGSSSSKSHSPERKNFAERTLRESGRGRGMREGK